MMWIRAAGGKWHVLAAWKWAAHDSVAYAARAHCGHQITVIQATDDESKMKGERCKTCQKYDR